MLTLEDSNGDGWSGTDVYFGDEVWTLESGGYATTTLCLAPGVYTPYACGGTNQEEVSWSIGGLTGGADELCAGTVGSFVVAECTDHLVKMYDSYGDGWTGEIDPPGPPTYLYIGYHQLTLASGSYGEVTLCLADGTYTPYACGGTFLSDVSWEVGGLEGVASDLCEGTLSFEVPSAGGADTEQPSLAT